MPSLVLIRGGGDLATGVAIRLLHAGIRVVITELPKPLVVRRKAAFAEAVHAGEMTVESITARCVDDPSDSLRILTILGKGYVPVLIDPLCTAAKALHPIAIVDGRMTKRAPEPIGYIPAMYIGLGPGFVAGVNCQVVVETQRGFMLGRVFHTGGPEEDTGHPHGDPRRVLRAPVAGILESARQIGDRCQEGETIAEIRDAQAVTLAVITSPFKGVLRGLLHPGMDVTAGMKIGDMDARNDPRLCSLVSEKALAIGGGVLEALLSKPEVRSKLWI